METPWRGAPFSSTTVPESGFSPWALIVPPGRKRNRVRRVMLASKNFFISVYRFRKRFNGRDRRLKKGVKGWVNRGKNLINPMLFKCLLLNNLIEARMVGHAE